VGSVWNEIDLAGWRRKLLHYKCRNSHKEGEGGLKSVPTQIRKNAAGTTGNAA